MKYLFIDGNNLGCRSAFANKDLGVDFIDYSKDTNPDDVLNANSKFPTGAMFGFFRTINLVRRSFPDRYVCVVWDGKSKSRILESRNAVANGVVPQAYKENRSTRSAPEAYLDFCRQRPIIMSALSMTNIPQVKKTDEEADDIIASFTEKLKGDDIMVLTNDRDYYQLLGNGVTILDSTGSVLDESWFKRTYGIDPWQWVEVGALQGDDGDNIFGVPWVGEKTAVKEILKHGTSEETLRSYHLEFDSLRDKFPDLKPEDFEILKNMKMENDNPVFPHIKIWMPFTGVALQYRNGKVKIPRHAIMSLVYESRVPLAKSLKAMHKNIQLPSLPVDLGRDMENDFIEFCNKYSLREVVASSSRICSRQIFG